MLKIKSVSRLHFTLIDMNGEHGRIDGSLGIALKEPHFIMKFRPLSQININANNEIAIEIQKYIDIL
jgi:beta-ribofuranosylaminobenzene 5'-phosphate synthase